MPVDSEALMAGVSRLARLRTTDLKIEELLDEVVGAVNIVFGLSGAGFLMIDDQNTLRSVVASDAAGMALEEIQRDTGEGPCVDAFVTDSTVATSDLASDDRYPAAGPVLVERGIHAVLGVPIRVGGGPIGSLNVFVNGPHDWTDDETAGLEAYGQLLGGLISAALVAEQRGQLAGQLQYALEYRVIIERAVGYLMACHNVDAVDAFNRLRRAARDGQRRVADLSRDVLEGRTLP
jgi:GAF domain-containing protein